MRKKKIEIIISKLKSYEFPKVELEQYETPSNVISEIVSEINLINSLNQKRILEIACGTGKFSIALAFFNPKMIIAFDIDKDAIKIAKSNYDSIKDIYNLSSVFFLVADVKKVNFRKKFDLVIMNPPFGIQGKIKDIEFLEFAFKNSNFVVSIHPNGKNLIFFERFGKKFNFKLIRYKKIIFRIRRLFSFHRKKEKRIEALALFFQKFQ